MNSGEFFHQIEHINKMLDRIPADEPYSHGACVCSVPRFFRSAKPEAFSPRLVGLGPYHHSNAELVLTDELKLGVAKRILNVKRIDAPGIELIFNSQFGGTIEALYHTDIVRSTNFSYILTVDGLFLLGFLHSTRTVEPPSYVFTGKWYGMTLVNAAGEELTLEGIVRDIFMLENQIPTLLLEHILEHIIDVHFDSIGTSRTYLSAEMLNLCRAFTPFVVDSERLLKAPESHNHLLDLMYGLIASESYNKHEVEPELERDSILFYSISGVIYLYLLLWIIPWTLVCGVVCIVQPFLQFILSVLVKVIPWSGAILQQPKMKIPNLPRLLSTVIDLFLYDSFTIKTLFTFPFRCIFKSNSCIAGVAVEKMRRVFQRDSDSTNILDNATIVPSVTELHKARIQFKPVEDDISSIKFDDIQREFYLPCIKLDATSEVILRNLAVYESLIENDRLNFSSYIELMRGLIRTDEDVKLMVDEKIIQTQLSAQVVAQIFKMPIGKLINQKPTIEIQELEGQLQEVKVKFDAIQNINLIFNAFLRVCAICILGVVFYPPLSQAFQQMWCSTIFGNSSKSCKQHQVSDYGGNSYFLSSM